MRRRRHAHLTAREEAAQDPPPPPEGKGPTPGSARPNRQLHSGYTFDTPDEALTFMNARHAVVDDGRTVVITEKEDPVLRRPFLQRTNFRDLEQFYRNSRVCIGTEKDPGTTVERRVYEPLGKFWLAHPDRRTYNGIVFLPEQAAPPGHLNLWKGFTTKPAPGSWSRMQEHITDRLCRGDEAVSRTSGGAGFQRFRRFAVAHRPFVKVLAEVRCGAVTLPAHLPTSHYEGGSVNVRSRSSRRRCVIAARRYAATVA